MVHRIHNRNPGYSDFSNIPNHKSFNFSSNNSNTISEGATALKLEDEISQDTSKVISNDNQEDYTAIATSEVINEVTSENSREFSDEEIKSDDIDEKNRSNGLENFGIDQIEESTPELFNSEKSDQEFSSYEREDNDTEDDDLEIPAFLRRQKN